MTGNPLTNGTPRTSPKLHSYGLLDPKCSTASSTLPGTFGAPAKPPSSTDVDPIEDEQNEPKLARLTRYYKQFESTLPKCTREIRSLQSGLVQIEPTRKRRSTA